MAEASFIDGGILAWTRTALGGAEPPTFNADTDIPLERIAELQPDLILATNSYALEPVYDKLEQIAPVVAWQNAPNKDPWQDVTRNVATALGKPQEGERVVRDTEAAVAEAREARDDFSIVLDADVLVGTTSAGGLDRFEQTPLFERLDVVKRGAYVSSEIGAATSIAFPTALSVQWAVDNVVPQLAEAASS